MSETGIYIRVGKENVLLENLDEIERTLWLQSLSENGLIRTVNRCCDVIEDFIVNYQHLQTNWKELIEDISYILEMIEHNKDVIKITSDEELAIYDLQNKMQEIEGGKNA